jgi:hypothetical protein
MQENGKPGTVMELAIDRDLGLAEGIAWEQNLAAVFSEAGASGVSSRTICTEAAGTKEMDHRCLNSDFNTNLVSLRRYPDPHC